MTNPMDICRMKQYGIVFAFLWGILLMGCAYQPTPIPTLAPVENTASPAPQPTATETLIPRPTTTTQPTVAPYLPADGPYLAYFRKASGKRELALMGANGKVYKAIPMPPEIADLSSEIIDMRLLSPDGNWLAFYTGSAGNLTDSVTAEKFDLALNLMNIKTGETYLLAHLLSKDYPKNFEAAAKQLGRSDITAESLQAAFLAGIKQSSAWSPDGRYLAFAGQMEGLSSDLYVYDTRYGTINRLSSGPQELQWISWSPDGKWIVHSSVYEVGEGMNFDVYVANVDGTDVRYLSTTSTGEVEDWLNPHVFFQHNSENGVGNFALQLVDVETGKATKVWDGAFMDFAFDQTGEWILVFAITPDKWPYDGNDPNFVSGNYLIDLVIESKTPLVETNKEHVYSNARYFGLGKRIFSLIDQTSNSVSFLTDDSKLTETKFSGTEVSVSPNKDYWLLLDEKVLKIFTADDQLVQEIPLPGRSVKSYSILWRPDESGVFLIADREIYALDLHSENFTLVENDLMKEIASSDNYKWVGEK
jgi:Tol biopolymer transport system component